MEYKVEDQSYNEEKILEEDLTMKSGELFITNRPSENRISTSLFITLFSIITLFFVYVFLGLDGAYFSIRALILFINIFISAYYTVNTIILGIIYHIDTDMLTSYWNFSLGKNSGVIRIIMGISLNFVLVKLTILSNQKIFTHNASKNDFNGIVSNFILKNYPKIMVAIIGISLLFLIKHLIIQFLRWRIHHQCYKDRILENEKLATHLIRLNNTIPGPRNPDPFLWSTQIYRILRDSREGLTVNDFKCLFGRDGCSIFKLFDTNSDGIISEEEFVGRYVSLFKEREQLLRSLDNNAEEMKKLNTILNLVIFPIGMYISFAAIGHGQRISTFLLSIMSVLLPLSFIFGPMVCEIFWSLIFIFLVRPYDLGDRIIIDGIHYSVGEMGLLYSVFYSEGKYHSFSNASLRSKVIINLRRSRIICATFNKKVTYVSAKGKMELLKNRISYFLKKNPQIYSPKFQIGDFLIEKEIFEFQTKIRISCPYQEVSSTKRRKDEFAVYLHENMLELGFEFV